MNKNGMTLQLQRFANPDTEASNSLETIFVFRLVDQQHFLSDRVTEHYHLHFHPLYGFRISNLLHQRDILWPFVLDIQTSQSVFFSSIHYSFQLCTTLQKHKFESWGFAVLFAPLSNTPVLCR